jgi:hypothetical protein
MQLGKLSPFRSLPFSIHLVPLCVAFDKIHAQQTPARFQLGLGFDTVGEKFQKIDEAGKQFGHGRRIVKTTLCGSIKKRDFRMENSFGHKSGQN